MEYIMYIAVPMIICAVLVPIVKKIGMHIGLYAEMNERTIHTKPIIRIGGVAVYIAFLVSMAIFVKVDKSFNAILLGGFVILIGGLIDDMINLKPIIKMMFQAAAAIILIINGVTLNDIHLPFLPAIPMGPVSYIVTFFWIMGITNAINLIDGLDGLCGGISTIILFVIGTLAVVDGRADVAMLSFILAGSIIGILFYNAYPASIFLGDSAALFIGYSIAAISLLGFKSSTAMTLSLPIILLIIPIVDTLSAILRRFLQGESFAHADRSHMHHVLMRRFGHRNTVLIMCGVTALCGISAYVYIINKIAGLILFLVIIAGFELFVEISGMISEDFHPVLSFIEANINRIKQFRKQRKK